MIHSVCKRLQQTRIIAHGYLFSTKSTSCAKPAVAGSNSTVPHALTVSYLSNSCGLSMESAIAVSKKIQFETTDQPESVLNLLKSYGLNKADIKYLITNRPLILKADPIKTVKPNIDLYASLGFSGTSLIKLIYKEPAVLETDAHSIVEVFRSYGFTEKHIRMLTMKVPTLYTVNPHKYIKPKMDYFKSLGIAEAEIATMLSSEPHILRRSLENQIIPSVEAIRRLVSTNDDVLKAIKASYVILEYNWELLDQNLAFLMNRGLPKSKVLKLFMLAPRSLFLGMSRLTEIVEEVEKLGFDSNGASYIFAIRTLAVMSKSLWEQKLEVVCSFGLSKDQIISAFRLQPMFMMTSEKKIKKLLAFFLNELKLKPSIIVKNPNFFLLSLEKRIIPRCSVLQLLLSKDIINANVRIINALRMTEKVFLEKFVTKYQKDIPEVVKAYQGKIKFQGFPIELRT